MAQSSIDVLLKKGSTGSSRGLLRTVILCTIAAAAVSSRLFSVIRMFTLVFHLFALQTSIEHLLTMALFRI